MWIRIWAVAAFMFAPLSAQFSGLMAPGNGADLYFDIRLPLKGSGQPAQGRIFEIGSTPLTQIAAVTNSGLPQPCLGRCCASNAYNLQQPDVSRDGAILAYTGVRDSTGSNCFGALYYETTVQGVPGKGTLTFPGMGRLSGNGRYLVLASPIALFERTEFDIIDLQTGEKVSQFTRTGTGFQFGTSGRVVADDGSFVVSDPGGISIYRKGQWITIPLTAGASNANDGVTDATGRTVMYEARVGSYWQLRYFHPDTQEDGLFLKGNGDVDAPSITADGRRVAFQSSARFGTPDPPGNYQVYIVNIDGTGYQALTSDPDGISRFILSDDGRTLWYVSANGALYEVNTATGETRQRIPPTCSAQLDPVVSPGSAADLYGSCFRVNLQVAFDGIPAPVLSPHGTWVQVPWEVQAPKTVTVLVDTGSPFEMLLVPTVEARPFWPGFVSLPIHQDWSGYVTASSPAHPGEILQLYATGLGPVQPPVATGVPGPTNPLARVTTPLNCSVPVLFAGLAPGLVGFYQVSLQMPSVATPYLHVSCGVYSWDIYMQP